jgi:TonB-linked SusC/RagA family outer membrane protein
MKKSRPIAKAILLCLFLAVFSLNASAQKVTLSFQNETFEKVLSSIKKQTSLSLVFSEQLVDLNRKVSIDVNSVKVEDALKQLLNGTNIGFEIKNNKLYLVEEKTEESKDSHVKYGKITGMVTDQNGVPIIGASIREKGTKKGTITDVNGKYTLDNVSPSAILIISYIGYLNSSIAVAGKTRIDITLAEDSKSLDEVVVTGYGSVSRSNLTTSISKVAVDKLPVVSNSSVNQMLAGRAAGLQVNQQSAEPGGNVNLSIRGRGNPLVVVDGVVVPNNELELGSGNGEFNSVKRGGLGNVNPNDIESIEVLKDASASIYGVAASNGVILITTKKGKAGKMNISYNGSHSVSKNMKYLQPLSPKDYMTSYNAFSKDYNGANSKYSDSDIANAGVGTNWLGLVLRDGSVDNHSVNINGGTEKVTYYFSGNYFNQIGTLKNSDMNRFSGKLNLGVQLSKILKFTTNINANRTNYTNSQAGWQTGGSGTNGFGALQSAISYPTYLTVYDSNGKYTQFATTGNPISLLDISDKTSLNSVFSNFILDIDLIPKMLSAKLLYGNSLENSKRNLYIPSDVFWGQIYQARGYLNTGQRQNQTMEATIAFNKNINDIFNIDVVAGMGQYIEDNNGSGLSALNLLDAIGTDNMGAAPTKDAISSYRNYEKRRSYFSRANFSLLDKYLLSLVYRADGIDKFFPNNKYASFPSASAAWKISNESFLKKIKAIELIKLRGSIGLTGMAIGTAAYGLYTAEGTSQQAYFDNGATIYTPYYQTAEDQPTLMWQKTLNANAGLDFGFFKNRISGSVDMFRDKITNLLTVRSTNQLSYIGSAYANGGSQIRNGYEIAIKTINIASKDFSWETTANLTHYLWRWETRYSNQDMQKYVGEKDGVNTIYVFRTNGILQTGETPSAWQPTKAQMAGAPKLVDVNGDGKLDYNDVVKYNSDPNLILGLGNNIRYKDFDFGIFFYAQLGAMDFANTLQWASARSIASGTQGAVEDVKNSWSTVNPNGTLPGAAFEESALGLPAQLDTKLSSKDFLRCRSISFGYNIHSPAFSKYFSNLRVYADVQNVFTISGYKGTDPEVQAVAVKGAPAPYPMARTYSIGLNVNF